ncbi:hypothetical protein ACQKP7_15940 [Pseudomonas frederiksbergensis]|uniref:hypothetical protein n=1 Tax=Pseudomonas frederiksbergensis TaxID=104087 RepID=UPI003CFEF952
MTISLAWTRKVDSVEELVVVTDSRLSFGCRWDCCPKIRILPREDAVVCFAGDTMYAYPIILQIQSAVAQHPKLLSRAMDITDLKGHLLRILNDMVSLVHDLPRGSANEPDATFLIAGWSWKLSAFKSWLLHYDASIKRLSFRPTSRWKGPNNDKSIAITGDYRDEYKERLIGLLRKKDKLQSGGFDMEPLEVLRDMLRAGTYDLIGGAPQVVKIYKYSSARPFAVFWPNKESGNISLSGRPLLDYEQSQYGVLDPDTMITVSHAKIP